jgi:hypothetical protein
MDLRNIAPSCSSYSRLLLLAGADMESPGAAMDKLRYSFSKINNGLGGPIHAFDQSTLCTVRAHRYNRLLALTLSPFAPHLTRGCDFERNASPNLPGGELPHAADQSFESLKAGISCRA